MEQEDIPEDVIRFMIERIDTVPHLEALLLLWESAPGAWSAEDIAVRVYVPPARATQILQDLARQRVAAPEAADAATAMERYRYEASWDETGTMMRKVADTYRRHLVRVANLIHSKASPAVRDFARAFQFKKDR
jgi:hypothetical protein